MVTNQTTLNLVLLSQLYDYKENWDGQGALPFDSTFLADCICLLLHLPFQPKITPQSNGTITCCFQKDNKNVEMTWTPKHTYDCYKYTQDTGVQCYTSDLQLSQQNILDELNWLNEEENEEEMIE